MIALKTFIDLLLHLNRYLPGLVMQYRLGIYGILGAAIFAETGLVVTPFLPGDSLLFGVGALAAADPGGTLQVAPLYALLVAAAVCGNLLNYAIGRRLGREAFSGRYRWVKLSYLKRTEAYFERYGGLTVLLSRFMPILRTFAPFVAGIGRMPLLAFNVYNAAGALAWVALFLFGGFAFGNVPLVRRNFGAATLIVIIVSLLPLAVLGLRQRRARDT